MYKRQVKRKLRAVDERVAEEKRVGIVDALSQIGQHRGRFEEPVQLRLSRQLDAHAHFLAVRLPVFAEQLAHDLLTHFGDARAVLNIDAHPLPYDAGGRDEFELVRRALGQRDFENAALPGFVDVASLNAAREHELGAVSYTHLDVYKRQPQIRLSLLKRYRIDVQRHDSRSAIPIVKGNALPVSRYAYTCLLYTSPRLKAHGC